MNQAVGVPHGVYGAISMATGKVAWTVPILTSVPSSGVAVAGDLVFFGDSTGLFYAANAATGEILWVFDALTVPGGGGAMALQPFMSRRRRVRRLRLWRQSIYSNKHSR
jgi:outer membrane protein assembly factor BamB